MDEYQYKELCNVCDSILKEDQICAERLSIAWLHIIREHPFFLRQYKRIFNGIIKNSYYWLGFRRTCIEIFRIFRQILRALIYEILNKNISSSSADIIFVSHRVSKSKSNSDFYFGTLPVDLANLGFKIQIVQIDHTSSSKSYFRLTDDNKKNYINIILPNTLGLFHEMQMILGLLGISKKISNSVAGEGLSKYAYYAAAAEALTNASFQTLRIAKQVSILIEQSQPKFLITTFEGHAWERVSFYLARKKSPSIKCIGYQHAALFKGQHSIRRKLGGGADPDIIWTSGKFALNELISEKRLSCIKIACIGSIRAFNSTGKSNELKFSDKENFTCLVLPEGLITECNFLFEFSIKCAKFFPKIRFIWRLHPIINFQDLSRLNPLLQNLPPNVVISTATMERDIERSDCAMYRGSTAIIQAVNGGLIPVYVLREGEMNIDPLYGAKHGVAKIYSAENFLNSINSVINCEDKYFIKKYCQEIFSPMTSAIEIKSLLDSA
jgi:hypothetical protein